MKSVKKYSKGGLTPNPKRAQRRRKRAARRAKSGHTRGQSILGPIAGFGGVAAAFKAIDNFTKKKD
jgi:hypothetical protein